MISAGGKTKPHRSDCNRGGADHRGSVQSEETIGPKTGAWPVASTPVQSIPSEWLADFEAAAARPLVQRLRYAFIHTYKPVMDDAPFRAFDSTAHYRDWCERHVPVWLGYGR